MGKVLHFLKRILERTVRYFKAVFSIPLVRDPVTFCRPDDFNAAGIRVQKDEKEHEEAMDLIQAACNYSEETKALFERILEDRRATATERKHLSGAMLDFSQLAPWNENVYDRLESIFSVFDTSGDGQVDLEEMTTTLAEFGDKSTYEDKRKVFQAADALGKGNLNFKEFCVMLHDITVKSSDQVPTALVETFRQIDRNMARIRGLDVVQQLQAGLF